VFIFGEVTLPHGITIDYASIAKRVIRSIGYTDPLSGFCAERCRYIIEVSEQSHDIAQGVCQKRTGAGDQGMMFGGAVAGEGEEYMPLPIMVAHAITRRYTFLYQQKLLPYLRPDGKAQVVVAYRDGKPSHISHVTIAASHATDVSVENVRNDMYEQVIVPVMDLFHFARPTKQQVLVNAGGSWTLYGPLADAGTTNRKIIVDTYGGVFAHGGGGFNGKDWTKVDVTGAVGARYVAKNLVAQGLAKKVQIAVCYALGYPDPLGIGIETYGTQTVPIDEIKKRSQQILDLSVDGILSSIDMHQPHYEQLGSGGWFGRHDMPWEKVIV
jgi:S-adenosylmethionine synthetase